MTHRAAIKDAPGTREVTQEILIRHLFISAAHNYFGHHGEEPGSSPNLEVAGIECVAGRGIRGDRFFDYREDYKGQITFFSIEVLRDVCARLGISVVSPAAVRRNVITEGVDPNQFIGTRFIVQDVLFEGVCECKPCYWMDRAITSGAEELLQGRGGLRARILTNGKLLVPMTSLL
jgi:MOSC domain-containing protein YiiM